MNFITVIKDVLIAEASRVWGCALLALLAYFFSDALEVPWWRAWEIGDGFDITLVTFLAAWHWSKPKEVGLNIQVTSL